jgi:hypothetical protein
VEPKSESFIKYSADTDATNHNDVPMAAFERKPFDKDVDFSGHFMAKLWVSSTSFDADHLCFTSGYGR